MKIMKKLTNRLTLLATFFALAFVFQSCEQKQKEETKEVEKKVIVESEKPEYFLLRPEVANSGGSSAPCIGHKACQVPDQQGWLHNVSIRRG